ncbi:PQQ-binding-like beta-propeller repeat protein [Planosporangium thailandense]|uniref:PQQ-binding-like beta-propeller repeat protein n=1 Tax=Planosporangium thailandense TaxID=765197 RepID=A0ABX0XT23_9ACTN|nr:PQQ-binding-like beta-propeller repeat protein [Planosporangium thailandense]NJC68389.1 PQQ-binding-like beta-propeller repeat protein [Planosporangium thailandense]
MSAAEQHEPVSIDLGVLPPSAAPDAPLPGPDLPRPPLWNPSRRRAVIVTALVTAVSALAGSAAGGARQAVSVPAPIPPPVTVAATGDLLAVAGDSVYTISAGGGDGGRLTAYSLRTGRRRWSVDHASGGQLNLLVAGSNLLLTSQPSGPVPANRDDQDPSWTAAIDARTGAVRWRHTGYPLWVAPRGDRVAMRTFAPPTGADNPGGPDDTTDRTVITVLAVATGALAAGYGPVAPGRRMSPVQSSDPGQRWLTGVFVREDASGGQLFDFASTSTRRLDLPLATPPPPMTAGAATPYEAVLDAGDLTLTMTDWGGRAALAGYSGEPPRPRWSVPDLTAYGAWRCGTALCGSDVETSFAVDPRTGQVRWQSPGGLLWRASAGRLYSSVLVANSGFVDRSRGTGIGVLDEATGRPLLRRDDWRPVSVVDGAQMPILSYTRGGEILAVLDARSLATERLAVLPLNQADCMASDAYVACRTGEGAIRAWRYSR